MSASDGHGSALRMGAEVEPTVELGPITVADLPEVAQFLHDQLDPRVPVECWSAQIIPTWAVDQPNHGFLLRCGAEVVGAHLAFYSDRRIDGRTERFCNLAAWCVAQPYRSHGVRLLRALLRQQGYHFTDLSPSIDVQALNTRLGFVALDTSTVMVPNVPWPVRSDGVRVLSHFQDIKKSLRAEDLSVYLDHAGAAAVEHAVIVRGAQTCHVMFRRVRRKNLPLFAALVHVGNQRLFRETGRHLFGHLLLHHGLPATLIESHVVDARFTGSVQVSPRAKMYRSDTLRADQIDYLYSELTSMRW
ncbi:hypothetical protein [Mycolicibacterium fluoranthenivorans]|uniref:N-acetyltransferase domain-containing protein n=1 Tax=Mycolicibacterium fluoranthenivorans TaxID=258505 RepID=A0A7X5U3S8_9MYCO|nr:hypothetical protein [Mycolicibacterium fluoranthenivorans]NIH97882.1 hypothetical protein [Mycolicibacterium fluoranthenivorans]